MVEVIHFDQFNLQEFQAKYQKQFRVILPENWRRILDRGDAAFLASQVEKYRALECAELPERHKDAINQKNTEREKIKDEDSIPRCSKGSCNISPPDFGICEEQYCSRSYERCSGILFWRSCWDVCHRYKIRLDHACLQSHAAAVLKLDYEHKLTYCESDNEAKFQACMENRQDRITQMQATNRQAEEYIAILTGSIDTMASRLATCGSILS